MLCPHSIQTPPPDLIPSALILIDSSSTPSSYVHWVACALQLQTENKINIFMIFILFLWKKSKLWKRIHMPKIISSWRTYFFALKFPPTWCCGSGQWHTTSSGWKLLKCVLALQIMMFVLSSTLVQHCTNGIQMFCGYWVYVHQRGLKPHSVIFLHKLYENKTKLHVITHLTRAWHSVLEMVLVVEWQTLLAELSPGVTSTHTLVLTRGLCLLTSHLLATTATLCQHLQLPHREMLLSKTERL